jgi:hypothetical protein
MSAVLMRRLFASLSSPVPQQQKQQLQWALAGWTFFIAENAILSENRTALINVLSDEGYHILYGTCSTAAMASIGYAYVYKLSAAAAVAAPTAAATLGSWMLLSTGLVMASQALPKFQVPVAFASSDESAAGSSSSSSGSNSSTTDTRTSSSSSWKLQVRCPFDFADTKNNKEGGEQEQNNIRGLNRISRHAGLWSLASICAASAITSPTWPLTVWWMGPTAVAWLGGNHTDSRFRRGMGGTLPTRVEAQTSNVPFVAVLTGKQGNTWTALQQLGQELKPLNAVVATGVATIFVLSRGRRVYSIGSKM